jgi:hypothetical protein
MRWRFVAVPAYSATVFRSERLPDRAVIVGPTFHPETFRLPRIRIRGPDGYRESFGC